MSYIINQTDGTIVTTILDGTINTQTGLTLIGRNYPSYGEFENENLVKLLENFADTIPPTESSAALVPLTGTLWFDTGNTILKVYNGTDFISVSGKTTSDTAPSSPTTGDQWYNTQTQQLYACSTAGAWEVVGPIYTANQGISGPVIKTINDINSQSHTLEYTYTAGNLVAITSFDNAFTPAIAISGFGNILPGINLISSTTLNGTAYNSTNLNGLPSTTFARVDQPVTFNSSITVNGPLSFTNANIFYNGKSLVLQNRTLGGNVEIYCNTITSGNVRAFFVDGTDGTINAVANPTKSGHLTTKYYVDQTLASASISFDAEAARLENEINQLRSDYFANIAAVTLSTNANLNAYEVVTNATIGTLSANTTARFTQANVNLAYIQSEVVAIQNYLPYLSTLNSPVFIGTPTAPTMDPNNNSNQLATTAYVDTSAAILASDYNAKFINVNSAIGLRAPIASPAFTGIPTAPTPVPGTSSSQIATTSYVQSIVTTYGTMATQNYNSVNITGGTISGVGDMYVNGSITASQNIIAFFSSDIKFKEDIRPIPNALATAIAIGGKLYNWTDEYIKANGGEDGYFIRKEDFGVIAQDVKREFSVASRTKPDGTLAVDYEKLCALAFAAIAELSAQVDALKTDK